jgi:hypothetical protein
VEHGSAVPIFKSAEIAGKFMMATAAPETPT